MSDAMFALLALGGFLLYVFSCVIAFKVFTVVFSRDTAETPLIAIWPLVLLFWILIGWPVMLFLWLMKGTTRIGRRSKFKSREVK